MKIAIAHNQYQFRGGEDVVVEQESKLLERKGHHVVKYIISNDNITGFFSKVSAFLNLTYSNSSRKSFYKFLVREKPDIVHVHNFFPLLTPSVFDACKDLNISVVMTLHNYRLICPSALLFHNHQIYEKSIRNGPMSTITDKVYRNSYIATYALARMIKYHKNLNTWSDKVDKIICLTQFQKDKFQEAGFNVSNFVLKPNFKFSNPNNPISVRQDKALFVGRLSEEKGLRLLLESFTDLNIDLEIAGIGPLAVLMNNLPRNISYLGNIDSSEVIAKMSTARCVVMPSLWYETFGLVLIEALSVGTPVICSNIGAMASIIKDGETGLHFNVGDKESLKDKVRLLFSDDRLHHSMSNNAFFDFRQNYSDSVNYRQLLSIYDDALAAR